MKLKKILATLVTTLICLPFIGCPLQAQVCNQEVEVSRFTDNGDGTVSDNKTELQWTKEPKGGLMLAQDAVSFCGRLKIAGHSDWRLPTEKELRETSFETNFFLSSSYKGYKGCWSYEESVSQGKYSFMGQVFKDFFACESNYGERFVRPVRKITSQELAAKKQELKEEQMRKLAQDTAALTQMYGKAAVEAFKSAMPNHDEIWMCVLGFAPDMANQLREKGLVTATGCDVFLKLQRDVELKSWLKNAVIVDGRTVEKSRCPNRLELVLSSTPGGPQEAAAIFFLEGNRIKFHDIWIEKGVLGRAEGGFVH